MRYTMPLSIRFSERSAKLLERLKRAGRFESKAEAVREALNTYEWIMAARRRGYRILAVPKRRADRLGLVLELR